MKFQCLLFDFDNTLVDFTTTSKQAFWQTFSDFDTECSDAIHEVYKVFNHQVWTAFERREMTAERLRIARFELLFDKIDQSPTTAEIFSRRFLENLVQLSSVYAGVHELLQNLSRSYQLGIITNGLKEVQRPRLDLLKMRDYFHSIVVSDEIGVAKPQAGFFEYAYARVAGNIPKEEILVIGDSLQSDISGGQQFGFPTCWISHERANATDIRPDFSISHVGDLPQLLDQLAIGRQAP